jgi:hypothetical protein
MDMGNSDAKVTEVNSSTITYGYGMSTPTISITITLKGSNYEVKFGISLGQQLVEVVNTFSLLILKINKNDKTLFKNRFPQFVEI